MQATHPAGRCCSSYTESVCTRTTSTTSPRAPGTREVRWRPRSRPGPSSAVRRPSRRPRPMVSRASRPLPSICASVVLPLCRAARLSLAVFIPPRRCAFGCPACAVAHIYICPSLFVVCVHLLRSSLSFACLKNERLRFQSECASGKAFFDVGLLYDYLGLAETLYVLVLCCACAVRALCFWIAVKGGKGSFRTGPHGAVTMAKIINLSPAICCSPLPTLACGGFNLIMGIHQVT